MNYIQLLRRIHRARGAMEQYLEIGCRTGRSLSLSRAKASVAVDPQFNISHQLLSPTRLFKMTSDAFFEDQAASVLKSPIDLAFIDGMHLSEFALRDFMNVEKWSNPNGWVVFDDVLPEEAAIASRTRHTSRWTGDIYKLTDILRRYRPDLEVTVFDVELKGLMLVRGLDPESRVLDEAYPEIEAELIRVDESTLSVEQMRDIARPVPPEDFSVEWAREGRDLPSSAVLEDAVILAGPTPRMRNHGVFRSTGAPCLATALYQGGSQIIGFAPPRLPEDPAHLSGEYLYGGMVAGHFGHIMLETFARLSDFDVPDLPVIFTVANASKVDLFWTIVEAMDLPRDRIKLVDYPCRVDILHVRPPSFAIRDRIEPDFVDSYATIGARIASRLGVVENSNPAPAYLSRCKTPFSGRHYFGETLVEQILQRHGVHVLYLEDLSMTDQIGTWLTRERLGGFAGSAFHTMLFASAPKTLTYLTTHLFNRNFQLIEGLKANPHEVCTVDISPVGAKTQATGPFLLSREGIVQACGAMGVEIGLEDVPDAAYEACVAQYRAVVG